MKRGKQQKVGGSRGGRKGPMGDGRRWHGPRLPNALRKELGLLNPSPKPDTERSDSDTEGELLDIYGYDTVAPEETRNNRRFDPVENYDYELPENFVDEEVPSDEFDDSDVSSDDSDSEGEEGGDKHLRMLQEITGIPKEAFEGEKTNKTLVADDGVVAVEDLDVTMDDLLENIQGKQLYSTLRKKLSKQQKAQTVPVPLPKVEQERVERSVVYEHSKQDLTKWEPLVKRNREAPTLYFEEDLNLGFSSIGAIAQGFEPRTEFEKKMAQLVEDPVLIDAHKNDGTRLLELELNTISVEDVKDRQDRLAKMRSLLFRHEMKAKRIKKIKSKTYRRLSKKDRQKALSTQLQLDPEAAKELARKQEMMRAEERMTLKHKNSSRWAKRILKRGLNVQDEGTRAAIAEQLNHHNMLTRKMKSMKDDTSSSSDDSSDDDAEEGLSPSRASERASKILNRAKQTTAEVIEEGNDIPKSGVFALPFMERSLKRLEETAREEAQLALQEYEESLKSLVDDDNRGEDSSKKAKTKGRKVFGPANSASREGNKRQKIEVDARKGSDSEGDFDGVQCVGARSDADDEKNNNDGVKTDANDKVILCGDELEMSQKSLFKSFDDIKDNPGPKTTYEVSIFTENAWKKVKKDEGNKRNSTNVEVAPSSAQITEEMDEISDSDSDKEEMVDEQPYELPSQADLIRQAFAGDDVEAEFEKDKLEVLDEENPEPEKPTVLPGWGQWTHVQKKSGMPAWMVQEHEAAKRKREEAIKKRGDAKLKNVIISAKTDKKTEEKFLLKSPPFPFMSKEVYEQSIRMPIGPDFNPAVSVSALNRPAVVKRAGMAIKPILFTEVNLQEKDDEPKHIIQKAQLASNAKEKLTSTGGKTAAHPKNKTTKQLTATGGGKTRHPKKKTTQPKKKGGG